MPDYTLSKLPSSEFERLCRDLLQKRDNVYLESFKDGKDGGIDLRYAKGKDRNIIVQAKCYKDWNELRPKLAREADKVKKLKPDRYIFVTSARLSPHNKDVIKSFFSPYIKVTQDILGNDDLNNLLGLHPEIEEQYYMLWLCSTSILKKILHRKIINWSRFKLEECIESKNTFVYNENYVKAKSILDKYNYVIISGIPGIGKTTLAEVLVLEHLKDDYEEFVFVPDKIDDALELFDDNKKQIFLFDDFLGSNSFEPASKNFDNNLASFIYKIRKSDNKKFILTTREYILQEAKLHYEKLAKDRIDIVKCTIDLGSYTNKIKAQILYNHLYYSNIPLASIESLLENNKFLQIVKHKNYNPRLVETIVVQQLWSSSSAGTFFDRIHNVFEHPNRIWEVAFNKLDRVSQYALLVLVTMPVPVVLKDWREAFLRLATNTTSTFNIPCDEASWKNSLKVLDGCFIKTDIYRRAQIVNFYNPSIIDFLIDYLKNMHETTDLLIENTVFADQLTSVFAQNDNDTISSRKIVLNNSSMHHLAKSVRSALIDYKTCDLNSHRYSDSGSFFKYLPRLNDLFPSLFEEFLLLTPELLSEDVFFFSKEPAYYKIETLDALNDHIDYLNKKEILEYIFEVIEDEEDLDKFAEYIVSNPKIGFVIDERIEDKARSIIEMSTDSLNSVEELETEREYAMSIFSVLGLNGDDLLSEIEDKIESIRQEEDDDNDYPDYDDVRMDDMRDAEIISLFQSLRDSGT